MKFYILGKNKTSEKVCGCEANDQHEEYATVRFFTYSKSVKKCRKSVKAKVEKAKQMKKQQEGPRHMLGYCFVYFKSVLIYIL